MRDGGGVHPCARRRSSSSSVDRSAGLRRDRLGAGARRGHRGRLPRLPARSSRLRPGAARRARGSRWCDCAASRAPRATTPFAPSFPTRRYCPELRAIAERSRLRAGASDRHRRGLPRIPGGFRRRRVRRARPGQRRIPGGPRDRRAARRAGGLRRATPDQRLRRGGAAQRGSDLRAQPEQLPQRRPAGRDRARHAERRSADPGLQPSARCGATPRRASRWCRSPRVAIRGRRRCPCA